MAPTARVSLLIQVKEDQRGAAARAAPHGAGSAPAAHALDLPPLRHRNAHSPDVRVFRLCDAETSSRAERRSVMRITVKTESGSSHTVLLPTGSGTSKQEAMMMLTAANVREGRRGSSFEGWIEVEARSESDSLWIRHDTIIEVLLEPMDTSPTLIDVRSTDMGMTGDPRNAKADSRDMTADVREADADAREVNADARGAEADSRDITADVREADADVREVDADARQAAVELRESAADERDAADAREGLSDTPTPDASS